MVARLPSAHGPTRRRGRRSGSGPGGASRDVPRRRRRGLSVRRRTTPVVRCEPAGPDRHRPGLQRRDHLHGARRAPWSSASRSRFWDGPSSVSPRFRPSALHLQTVGYLCCPLVPPRLRTVTVPDRQLLERLAPFPPDLDVGVWDLRSEPVGVRLEAVQVVVLPCVDAGPVLGRLSCVTGLALVQTQTTGYDGVREAVAHHVAIATASGVHAAATAELAIGLVLASLRGIDTAARDQRAGRRVAAEFRWLRSSGVLGGRCGARGAPGRPRPVRRPR